MRRKDILDKILEKVIDYLGCYNEESFIAPVDRDRFLKALCNEIGYNYAWKPVWIQVTDRLPEDGTFCLVTREPIGGGPLRRTGVEIDYWCEDEDGVGQWIKFDSTWKVTAWMPMPEAYGGGQK